MIQEHVNIWKEYRIKLKRLVYYNKRPVFLLEREVNKMSEKELLEKIEKLEKRVEELEKDMATVKEDMYIFTEDEIDDEENNGCTGCCSSCEGCE